MLLTSLLTGCAAYEPARALTQPPPAEFDAVWNASLTTLKSYQFEIDRLDRRGGRITTFPMTGKSWLEFWRKDSASPADTLESSLQTIYHQAVVQLEPVEGTGLYRPAVQVRTTRANRPQPQVTNTSEAYELFNLSSGRRRARFLMNYGEDVDPEPVALPDDTELAAKIRWDIGRLLAQQPGPQAAAAQPSP